MDLYLLATNEFITGNEKHLKSQSRIAFTYVLHMSSVRIIVFFIMVNLPVIIWIYEHDLSKKKQINLIKAINIV